MTDILTLSLPKKVYSDRALYLIVAVVVKGLVYPSLTLTNPKLFLVSREAVKKIQTTSFYPKF